MNCGYSLVSPNLVVVEANNGQGVFTIWLPQLPTKYLGVDHNINLVDMLF